nr:hypothetical protein GCM10020093_043070 [Planobispora longispora]
MFTLMWKFDNPNAADTTGSPELAFETPSAGDGFAFRVAVHCAREAGGGRRARRSAPDLGAEREEVLDRARTVVRETCRRHPAFRPESAEREVNRRLEAELRDGPWTVRVEVGLTEEVRRLQQTNLIAQHKVVTEAESTELRLERLHALSTRCEGFLRAAGHSWETLYALRLAEDPARPPTSWRVWSRTAGRPPPI